MGSVFSPRYARARAEGEADPRDHAAVNVSLHAPGLRRWVMTEVGRTGLDQAQDRIAVSGTTASLGAEGLTLEIDERCAPFGERLAGRIDIEPAHWRRLAYPLDHRGRHGWWPAAPVARARVSLDAPGLRFEGHAYHDVNWGTEGLEDGFAGWTWSRRTDAEGTGVVYDTVPRVGAPRSWSGRFDATGMVEGIAAPVRVDLGRTRWGLSLHTRADGPVLPRERLVDAPFYARTLLQAGDSLAVHESVDLDRFASRWVRFLLPFRMRSAG